jgi:uncharacterized integral membrane protein
MWHRVKLAGLGLLVLLTLTVILQNVRQTEAKLLFWTFSMPLAALLLVVMLGGFAFGMLAHLLLRSRKAK